MLLLSDRQQIRQLLKDAYGSRFFSQKMQKELGLTHQQISDYFRGKSHHDRICKWLGREVNKVREYRKSIGLEPIVK